MHALHTQAMKQNRIVDLYHEYLKCQSSLFVKRILVSIIAMSAEIFEHKQTNFLHILFIISEVFPTYQ